MIINQPNKIAQAVIANGLVTGNSVQNPDNLLNTTDSTALFGATSDVIIGNFPFNLPMDAVIVGIEGILKARILDDSVPSGSITPVLVDSSSGTNQYYPGPAITGLSDVLQEYGFGGDYDVWGNIAWTPTQINNLRFQMIANSSLEVAWASLTVFYYIPQTSLVPAPFALPGCPDCDSQIQALPFRLAQVWRSNETTLVAKSFSLPNGDPITLSMLGDCGGTINLTIDPDLRKEDGGNFIENFNIDASIATITNLPNGLVQIDLGDIQQRGLDFVTPYGYDADNISEHAEGALFIITNNGPFNGKLLKRCHVGTVVSAPIEVQDEGSTIGNGVDIFNFRGDNIQATQDPVDPYKVNVDVVVSPTNTAPVAGSTSSGTNGSTPSLTLTIPHTIGASENYLRVWVSTQDIAISGVTFNGVAMTLVGSETNAPEDLKAALYELVNPAVGLHNIVITMASSALISGGGVGYENVDTASPTVGVSSGATGADNAPTDSLTTTVDNVVIQDVVATKTNPTTFTQYGLWSLESQVNAADRAGASSVRLALAPQTVVDQYGLNAAMDWVIILAGIRGAVAVPPTGIQSVTGNYIDNTDPLNPVSVVPLNNTAVTAPTINDDESLGYAIDSKWFDSNTGILYTCEDATNGAAVWTAINTTTSGVQSVTDDGNGVVSVDNTDPANPEITFDQTQLETNLAGNVEVATDGVTITGDGTTGNPLVAVQGAVSVTDVTEFDDFLSVYDLQVDDSPQVRLRVYGNFAGNLVVFTSETNHPGIVQITNGQSMFGFCETQDDAVDEGLFTSGNDFRIEILTKVEYSTATTNTMGFSLPSSAGTDPFSLSVIISTTTFTPSLSVNGAGVGITAPVKPVSGTWYSVIFDYTAGVFTATYNGTVIYTAAVSFTENDCYQLYSMSGSGISQFFIDYIKTGYTVTR